MAKETENKPAKDGAKAKPAAGKAPDKAAEKRPRAPKTAASEPLEKAASPKSGSGGKARLRKLYATSVVPALTKDFGYKNPMAVPRVEKVSLNVGLGEATGNSKLMDGAVNELAA